MDSKKQFWTGYKPCTVVDLINKQLASQGSPSFAALAENANYNGHPVTMRFNDRRGYWIAEYSWAGRNVIARGSFREVLNHSLIFHGSNGSAGSLIVYTETDEEAQLCLDAGLTPHSREIESQAWSQLIPDWVQAEANTLVWASRFQSVDFSKLIHAVRDGKTQAEYQASK